MEKRILIEDTSALYGKNSWIGSAEGSSTKYGFVFNSIDNVRYLNQNGLTPSGWSGNNNFLMEKTSTDLKVIRKVFFKTITKVSDGISGITKNIIFFHLKACERRNFDFCVFLSLMDV